MGGMNKERGGKEGEKEEKRGRGFGVGTRSFLANVVSFCVS